MGKNDNEGLSLLYSVSRYESMYLRENSDGADSRAILGREWGVG
jgi:hypothetical protein